MYAIQGKLDFYLPVFPTFTKKLLKWTWESEEQLPLLTACSRCEEIIVTIKTSKEDQPLGDKPFSSIRSLMKLQEIQATIVGSPVVRDDIK